MSKIASLFIILSSLFAIPAIASDTDVYTITFDSDEHQKILVEVPNGWEVEENVGDTLYDFKLVNKDENKTCFIFTALSDTQITSQDLQDVESEILEELYVNKTTENHKLFVNPDLRWYSFDLVDGDNSTSVGLAVYPIDRYFIGIAVEAQEDLGTLLQDCNVMISNVSLYTFPD